MPRKTYCFQIQELTTRRAAFVTVAFFYGIIFLGSLRKQFLMLNKCHCPNHYPAVMFISSTSTTQPLKESLTVTYHSWSQSWSHPPTCPYSLRHSSQESCPGKVQFAMLPSSDAQFPSGLSILCNTQSLPGDRWLGPSASERKGLQDQYLKGRVEILWHPTIETARMHSQDGRLQIWRSWVQVLLQPLTWVVFHGRMEFNSTATFVNSRLFTSCCLVIYMQWEVKNAVFACGWDLDWVSTYRSGVHWKRLTLQNTSHL